MCGIAGLLTSSLRAEEWVPQLSAMGNALSHRGPDDSGVWFDAQGGIGLTHRRLAILDPSPDGHQPMCSPSGKLTLVYNGEIYNYRELHRELINAGISFQGTSDTEVLLRALETWGLSLTLERITGMFSFALWNRETRTLTLARDRIGIKPLYYGFEKGHFFFSSELRPLRSLPFFSRSINRDSIALFSQYNYIPSPYSIYHNVQKLQPGTYLTFSPSSQNLPTPSVYWSSRECAQRGLAVPFTGSFNEAQEKLTHLLSTVIKEHMISDVPLGAFLSGGIDSSLVCALMQKQSTQAVKTFCIGLQEKGYNEATYAMEVSKHLGTDHTELYLSSDDILQKIPTILSCYDEPFADSSQLPTWVVSSMTRSQVTVALSGDGGDELFAGYVRYQHAENLWKRLSQIPPPLRMMATKLIRTFSTETWSTIATLLSPLIPRRFHQNHIGDKIHRIAAISSAHTPQDLYSLIVSHDSHPHLSVPGSQKLLTEQHQPDNWTISPSLTEQMMLLDLITYLPGDILTKVDRASMGVSLEARVPLLDHRIVEFAWSLPLEFKLYQGEGKRILHSLLAQHLPPNLFDRPKKGFGIPIGEWMKGPLREWSEELLSPERLKREGFWDVQRVQKKWKEHLAGKNFHDYFLWNILVFQNWLEKENSSS